MHVVVSLGNASHVASKAWIHWTELLVCWVPVAPQDIIYYVVISARATVLTDSTTVVRKGHLCHCSQLTQMRQLQYVVLDRYTFYSWPDIIISGLACQAVSNQTVVQVATQLWSTWLGVAPIDCSRRTTLYSIVLALVGHCDNYIKHRCISCIFQNLRPLSASFSTEDHWKGTR